MPDLPASWPPPRNAGPTRRPRLAVVIGSGGIKCAAAVGMWRVLQREGIQVDLIVGCSGGALYGATMALGMDASEAERRSLSLWQGLFSRLHYPTLVRALLPRLFRTRERIGLINDRRVGEAIFNLVGEATFEDTRIPLRIATTDLHSGAKVDLDQGSIAAAVRASIAIPLLLRPWPINGQLLVDGGLANPLPLDIAIREGADIILAMGFETPPAEQVHSLVSTATQSVDIAINNLLRSTFAFYNVAHHAELITLMPEFEQPVGLRDTHLLPHIMDTGERAMQAEMPYLRKLLSMAPRQKQKAWQ